jgi:putative tricarboxylic transport membrane protein
MLDILIPILSGTAIGFFVGLMPGIGASTMMILLFPFLLKIDLQSVLIFYCCMISAAQFGGSVTALALGLPGEQNSYPLIAVRQEIIDKGQQAEALFVCAFGHLLGALLIFSVSWWFIDILAKQTGYLKTYVMISLCALAMVMALLTSRNRWHVTLLMMIAAWICSRVGSDHRTGEEILTFGNSYLAGGLPNMAVITGFFVVPMVYEMFIDRTRMVVADIDTDLSARRMYELVKDSSPSMLRGSVIGFFSGLIPYVGVDLSSYLGFFSERYLKNNTIQQIAAAETATNAAAISVLLPLLIYGIAILTSENLLLEVVNSSSRYLTWAIVEPMFHWIALSLVIANTLSFVLSWNLARPAVMSLDKIKRYTPYVMSMLLIYSVWQLGSLTNQSGYYLIVVSIFGLLGMMCRHLDRLPFILIFLLHEQMGPAILRFIALYS